jgi:hypothetical protein
MPLPETIVAEGDLPTGEHWTLLAGGTADDYDTVLQTVHSDGHRDSGGMGGPLLEYGYMDVYSGRHDRGLRRVIIRANAQVVKVLAEANGGEQIEIPYVGNDMALGLVFFAALLPPSVSPTSVTGFDGEGQAITQSPIRSLR